VKPFFSGTAVRGLLGKKTASEEKEMERTQDLTPKMEKGFTRK
jgi:hypothetical protein